MASISLMRLWICALSSRTGLGKVIWKTSSCLCSRSFTWMLVLAWASLLSPWQILFKKRASVLSLELSKEGWKCRTASETPDPSFKLRVFPFPRLAALSKLCYLSIVVSRRDRFLHFLRALERSETQMSLFKFGFPSLFSMPPHTSP